ncbi:MAG: hypothetical protein PF484_14745 [Bacteroidales bacterium]|jgi:hypothetical protein|nr:hypothetical protein [Bacteroidales bacterium]
MNKLKKKRRKTKFKTITFKLSIRQFKSLKNYSLINKTSPIKVIKSRVQDCLEDYSDEQIGHHKIAKNQLNLFKPSKPEEEQLEMFE